MPGPRDALDACEPLGVNVEIKNLPGDPDFDPACGIVAKVAPVVAARTQPILVSSFHAETLDVLRDLEPSVATALLTFALHDSHRRSTTSRRPGTPRCIRSMRPSTPRSCGRVTTAGSR